MCIIAYIRDSWSGLSRGAIQAAVAASPAFAFQSVTASAFTNRDHPRVRKSKKVKILRARVFIGPPYCGVEDEGNI
jgi:hypothetical protein